MEEWGSLSREVKGNDYFDEGVTDLLELSQPSSFTAEVAR